MNSDIFFDFVCSELKVVSEQRSSFSELKNDLDVSQRNKSSRGEIFFIRKILDSHIRLKSSKYDWEDELPIDNKKHCEDQTSKNQASVRTLVFYWNEWKENVLDIFVGLESLHKEEPNEHEGRVDFILNYFGVRKQCVKGNFVYLVVDEHADWIRNADQKGLQRDGKILTMNIMDLVFSMRSYWQSELVSVGIKVLETLKRLLNKSKSNGSMFHQSTSLLHIFEVSKFLLDIQHVNTKDMNKLDIFLKISLTYFDLVFPLDWRRSVSRDLISLRETNLSFNLLEEIIHQSVDSKGDITYSTIGRVMMICLGSRKSVALYKHIITRIQGNLPWKSFFEIFMDGGFKDDCVAQKLLTALEVSYEFNREHSRSISPHSFVYLLESLLFMASLSSRIFFTTKSAFVGWFTHIHSTSTYLAPEHIVPYYTINYIVGMIKKILFNKSDISSWIEKSNIDSSYYYPLLSLKLVMILSIICLQVSDYSQVLLDLLSGRNNIAYLLPKKFVYCLLRRRKGCNLNLNAEVVAAAFMSIDDSLLIVWSGNVNSRIHAPYAIFVDPRKSKEEILTVLFPRKTVLCVQKLSNSDDIGTILEAPSSSTLPDENLNVNLVELQMNWQVIEDISAALNGTKRLILNTSLIKKELDENLGTLVTVLEDKELCASKDATVVHEANLANNDLKLLSSSLIYSIRQIKEHSLFMKTLQGVVERLQSRRPKIDEFLNHSAMSQQSKIAQKVVSESSSTTKIGQTSAANNYVKGTGDDSVVVENQSGGGSNTQDANNKKAKRRNRKKKG